MAADEEAIGRGACDISGEGSTRDWEKPRGRGLLEGGAEKAPSWPSILSRAIPNVPLSSGEEGPEVLADFGWSSAGSTGDCTPLEKPNDDDPAKEVLTKSCASLAVLTKV